MDDELIVTVMVRGMVALVNRNELICCCDDDKTESLFYSLMSNKVKKAQVLIILGKLQIKLNH